MQNEYIRQVVNVKNLSEQTKKEIYHLFTPWDESMSESVLLIIGFKKGTTVGHVLMEHQEILNKAKGVI